LPNSTQKQNMRNKTNIRTLLIGTALGALLVLSIAAATTQTSAYGRFQLATGEGYIFKIDTTTGQVWKSFTTNPSAGFMSANVDK